MKSNYYISMSFGRSVSGNPVVGPRASGCVTGKDGKAGDIGVYRRYSRTQSSHRTSRSKPDRILRQAPWHLLAICCVVMTLSCRSPEMEQDVTPASNGSAPTPKQLPATLYLTSLGTGQTKEAADNEAYRGISKIFGLDLSSVTHTTETYAQRSDPTGTSQETTFDYDDSIEVTTRMFIENVTIASSQYDVSTGLYQSLAVLNKRDFSAILLSRIQEKDLEIRRLKTYIATQPTTYLKFLSLLKIHLISVKRAALYQKLRIVYGNYQQHVPLVTLQESDRQLREFGLHEFKVGIVFEGSFHQEIEQLFSDALSQHFIYISQGSTDTADLIISGSLTLEDLPDKTLDVDTPFKTVKWSFDMKIVDTASDKTILTESMTQKQTHISYALARDRIRYKLQTVLINDVTQKIMHTFYGE